MKKFPFNRSSIMTILIGIASAFGSLHAQVHSAIYLDHGLFVKNHPNLMGLTDRVMEQELTGNPLDVHDGTTVRFPGGAAETWKYESADSSHWFKGDYLNGAYGLFTIEMDHDKTCLLESMGNELVCVNGEPREGNKYGYKDNWDPWEPAFNYARIPVRLKKGVNQLLFVCNRGVLKVGLVEIYTGICFNATHVTLPDLVEGKEVNDYAAIDVINATDNPMRNLRIRAVIDNGISSDESVPLIQPMSVRKVAFKLTGTAQPVPGTVAVKLTLSSTTSASELDTATINLKIVRQSSSRKVTFISDIDGSVQYYTLVPPLGTDDGKPKALFLSLHGADVYTPNMANSYYPKTWGYIVCPTNGGPYGFDWEDWGRLDALQVLGIAKNNLNIDPSRVYLTGHSMGGHGTWIIGAQYPDRFGAIGPSAGWISWWTYVLHHDTLSSPMGEMLRRATMPVHTYKLSRNFKQLGVYVLHGTNDDNVPVTESRNMTDTLATFDRDFVFHEQPGVGHWWGLNDQAGTDCVDWPAMFDYFAAHARPGEKRIQNIDFTTANPGVSATDYWLTIYSQEIQLEPSRAIVKFVPSRNIFVGTTTNVKMICFDTKIADNPGRFTVSLDGTTLDSISAPEGSSELVLVKSAGKWQLSGPPPADDKNPGRYGTFKDAFRHDEVFVYGTHGTSAENEWAFDKARFDAEYFWYQGDESIEVESDREFDSDKYSDRNVIIYGNEETNSAYDRVIGESPVKISEGEIKFGTKIMKGNDLACFMVRPRKGSSVATVGIVAGTGLNGMRLASIVPCLQPGYALPDLTIFDSGVFNDGESGVRLAGFFGLDWGIESGDFIFRK